MAIILTFSMDYFLPILLVLLLHNNGAQHNYLHQLPNNLGTLRSKLIPPESSDIKLAVFVFVKSLIESWSDFSDIHT